MTGKALISALLFFLATAFRAKADSSWIRVNQLGYRQHSLKIAVLGSKTVLALRHFDLVDAETGKSVFTGSVGNSFGVYGPFADTYRLDFSAFTSEGKFFLRAGKASSPVFSINDSSYKGAADFCLRYMRQQRSGFNPFLNDSCHTHDGYTLYAPVPDSSHINATGGWHDASDYLQYSTTTANATYHLLAAYRDFPSVFRDHKKANGLDGRNNIPDVLDEARWGLDWMLKMHPKPDWMFNQVGDDRDHTGMRIPKEDSSYGRGLERPVYFCSGEPQVRGRFKNNSTGVASTAGKFAGAFALGSKLFFSISEPYADTLRAGSFTAIKMGFSKPGVCQTASVRSPYIYAEENWKDDMELACAAICANENFQSQIQKEKPAGAAYSMDNGSLLEHAYRFAREESITPWLGKDTALHYQWYPFINIGHYELATMLDGKRRDSVISFYKKGIERVWNKARMNAFYRGVPFIWCSNNLTVSFAIQCYWYRQLTNDNTYLELEQACFDWVFGCNPWGTSMVYGLPTDGDTPVDPHSAFTRLKNYPIDGGLVDGPVYTSIYKSLIGITLSEEDEYAPFQSDVAVYHDDYGDYSTNEPTMDGTASLIYLLAANEAPSANQHHLSWSKGAIVRGDSTRGDVALVFTADEFGDGLPSIIQTLNRHSTKASFFFTGRFYRDPRFSMAIQELAINGHYLGPHSDRHLLYCDWKVRDSLLVTKAEFMRDIKNNISAMHAVVPHVRTGQWYIPPYEWWNDTIAAWSKETGLQVMGFTPGIRTNADYTFPEMGASYISSSAIMRSVKEFDKNNSAGLNGAVILIHAGTDPRRRDKFYLKLGKLISYLKQKGYRCRTVDELLVD